MSNCLIQILRQVFQVGSVAAILLFSLAAQAEPIVGVLQNHQQGLFLVLHETSTTHLIDARPETLSYLRRLKSGDALSGNGRFSADRRTIYINAIDRIGLQDILGTWSSPGREIFEFQNYNRLNVYVPLVRANGISLQQTRSLDYVVTPHSENHFNLFMTDQAGQVRMAFLTMGKGRLDLQVTDFYTGLVTEKISLLPLFPR